MDIGFTIDRTRIDIRIILIIETKNGYIFQKGNNLNCYWIVDDKIHQNESSDDAAKRMLEETFGIITDKIKLNTIVESFYVLSREDCREFCFVYKCKVNRKIHLSDNYCVFSKEEMETKNIRPKIIFDIINCKNKSIKYINAEERMCKNNFYFA